MFTWYFKASGASSGGLVVIARRERREGERKEELSSVCAKLRGEGNGLRWDLNRWTKGKGGEHLLRMPRHLHILVNHYVYDTSVKSRDQVRDHWRKCSYIFFSKFN